MLHRLIAGADVVLENFRPGTLAKYSLGPEELLTRHPRLIYCSISGFGHSGPYAERSGYDYLVQAMGGQMAVTGLPDGAPGASPMRVGVPIADICAGNNAAIAILAALPASAGLVVALVLATGLPLWGGLLLLMALDIAILVAGYIAVRRPFSSSP